MKTILTTNHSKIIETTTGDYVVHTSVNPPHTYIIYCHGLGDALSVVAGLGHTPTHIKIVDKSDTHSVIKLTQRCYTSIWNNNSILTGFHYTSLEEARRCIGKKELAHV